jgi:hypothetical protein
MVGQSAGVARLALRSEMSEENSDPGCPYSGIDHQLAKERSHRVRQSVKDTGT